MAELYVLIAEITQEVSRAYRKALTASRRNQFYLQSSLAQLEILRSLEFRAGFVQAGINVINEELGRIHKELVIEEAVSKREKAESPTPATTQEGMVFLFTGYMIDISEKGESHFPPEKESDIKAAINAILDKYRAGPDDLAVTTGMDAGSEILFA